MKRHLVVSFFLLAAVLTVNQPVRALEASTTTLSVEERLAILERKAEGSVVTSGKEGFQIKSGDGAFVLRISGLIQADYRDYLGDHGSAAIADQFLMRRVRPTFEGTLNKVIGFRITPEFANVTATTTGSYPSFLADAYFDLNYFKMAKLRFGKMKPPFGLENLISDPTMAFNERSMVTQLVPIRDTGVQLSGEFKGGQLSYQAAIMNGVPDGAVGETDSNDAKEYLGRIFLQPFKSAGSAMINGLGFGLAGSIGDQFGDATNSGLTSGYRTDGQQRFYSYQAGVIANGQRKRMAPQGHWYFNHLGLLGEYVASSQEISSATQTATVSHSAWQVSASWVLTGERPSFAGIKPKVVFDPKNHTWGAFELAARYANFQADDEAFNKSFSSLATSAKKAKSCIAGVNWYLNNNLRINSDYAVTRFTGGAAGGNDRATEKVILSRVQVTF